MLKKKILLSLFNLILTNGSPKKIESPQTSRSLILVNSEICVDV